MKLGLVVTEMIKRVRSQLSVASVAYLWRDPGRLRAALAINSALTTEQYFAKLRASGARGFDSRFELLSYSISKASSDGLVLEFGVAGGESINYIASLMPSRRVFGFDTFKGLPEIWNRFPQGTFSMRGILPPVRANVYLVQGLFQTTLPNFLKEHDEPIAFLHMDADLYSSTKFVLETLGGRIQDGTIIQFDELCGYRNWERGGEYRAYAESLAKRPHSFLGYVKGQQQVSIQLK